VLAAEWIDLPPRRKTVSVPDVEAERCRDSVRYLAIADVANGAGASKVVWPTYER